jgi:nitrate reductase NapE component
MVLRIALFVLMAVGLLGFGAVAWFSAMPAPPPELKAAEVAPV